MGPGTTRRRCSSRAWRWLMWLSTGIGWGGSRRDAEQSGEDRATGRAPHRRRAEEDTWGPRRVEGSQLAVRGADTASAPTIEELGLKTQRASEYMAMTETRARGHQAGGAGSDGSGE